MHPGCGVVLKRGDIPAHEAGCVPRDRIRFKVCMHRVRVVMFITITTVIGS